MPVNVDIADPDVSSSFYGLLDLLSATELNDSQRETVATAKQSCELLLKVRNTAILGYGELKVACRSLTRFWTTASWKHLVSPLYVLQGRLPTDSALALKLEPSGFLVEVF